MKEKIGFMGLGIMGTPMALNIMKADYPLTVYNRSTEKTAPLTGAGATAAASPLKLAEGADVVVVMVTGPEAINELLWGTDGAAAAFGPDKTFINMSSVSPAYTRDLAERLRPTGVTFLDAPVSGTKKPAEDAQLVILGAGDEEAVRRWTPLLETMSKKVVYCGPAGQGSMMKMMINMLLGIMMEGFAETLAYGRKGGLEMAAMLEVIDSGAMACPMYKAKRGMIEKGEYPPHFPLKHMAKDLQFALETAYQLKAGTPALHTVAQLFRAGVGWGLGDLDLTAVNRVLETMNQDGLLSE